MDFYKLNMIQLYIYFIIDNIIELLHLDIELYLFKRYSIYHNGKLKYEWFGYDFDDRYFNENLIISKERNDFSIKEYTRYIDDDKKVIYFTHGSFADIVGDFEYQKVNFLKKSVFNDKIESNSIKLKSLFRVQKKEFIYLSNDLIHQHLIYLKRANKKDKYMYKIFDNQQVYKDIVFKFGNKSKYKKMLLKLLKKYNLCIDDNKEIYCFTNRYDRNVKIKNIMREYGCSIHYKNFTSFLDEFYNYVYNDLL